MTSRILEARWPAVAWTVLIFILLIIPSSGIPKQGMLALKHLDKLAHLLLFGVFVLLWYPPLRSKGWQVRSARIVLFLLSSGYGIAMEFVQLGFTERAFEGWDIVADALGAALAAAALGWGK
ncbi:MAG: hypothetical protein FJX89_04250 [Bacteroidetes bacterium]|nr:hypothetical protein [Bacteroidota bacterium]